MTDTKAIIYISDECYSCQKLMEKMDQWEVNYKTKNITSNNANKKELQEHGIYGTPATFIKARQEPILGYQINKIKHALGIHA